MKRKLEISLEQAKELLETMPSMKDVLLENFPELKPKPVVLDRWEDLERIVGFWIEPNANITRVNRSVASADDRNIFATKAQAKSALAYAQLTQLMKATGDCDVDWNNKSQPKYCIVARYDGRLEVSQYSITRQFIAFKTESVCVEFFKKHERLLKEFFQMQ